MDQTNIIIIIIIIIIIMMMMMMKTTENHLTDGRFHLSRCVEQMCRCLWTDVWNRCIDALNESTEDESCLQRSRSWIRPIKYLDKCCKEKPVVLMI